MTAGPVLGQFDIAPLPPVDQGLLEVHIAGQQLLADALAGADPVTDRLFRHVQLRLLLEGIAGVDPVVGDLAAVLVPPRRRFLADARRLRLEGCATAVRFIDSRLMMRQLGSLTHVISADAPVVLHAFVEAQTPHGQETNPGMIRATTNKFAPENSTFLPPPPQHCASLLHASVEFANTAPAPAVVRGAWLLASLFAVHPFVDGNGRTARLLLHGLMSEASPSGFDWGTQTMLTNDRTAYSAAARTLTDPSLPEYDARKLNPLPLIEFVIQRSLAGDRLTLARLAAIRSAVHDAVDSGFDENDSVLWLAVAADRNSSLTELEQIGIPADEVNGRAASLIELGWLRWDDRGHLQVGGDNPFMRAG